MPIPASHRGTQPDGALLVDADGRFEPTREVLQLFEYHFLALGEPGMDEAQVLALLEAEIRARLPEAAARDARELLARYQRYRERARALHESGAAPADLERRLQWLRELRRDVFGAAIAEALFGEEERASLVALERQQVYRDATLSEAEKRRRLDAIDDDLPQATRDARHRRLAPQRVAEEVAVLRESGASEAEVYAVRERAFGPEAAERLARLGEAQARWRARLAAYHRERDALRAQGGDPGAIEQLRVAHFAAAELPRVRALDAVAAGSQR